MLCRCQTRRHSLPGSGSRGERAGGARGPPARPPALTEVGRGGRTGRGGAPVRLCSSLPGSTLRANSSGPHFPWKYVFLLNAMQGLFFCSWKFHSTIGQKKIFFSTQAVLAPNMDLTSVSPNASRTEGCSCSGNFRILERTLNVLKKKNH